MSRGEAAPAAAESGAHRALLARHRAVLPDWPALHYAEPLEITHGEGRHVWDAEGGRCLDFFGGSPVTMAAANANLTHLLDHDLQGNARRVGGLLLERLRTAESALAGGQTA